MTTTITPVYAQPGSVSSGTMRPEDLIPAFSDALDNLKDELITSLSSQATFEETETVKQRVAGIDSFLAEIETRQESPDYYESEDSGWDLESLFDTLDKFAPPYCGFGSHPGDGADYGFWISEEIQEDGLPAAIHDGDPSVLMLVSDLSEVPDDHSGDVLDINDHGNMTLYACDNGKLSEVWGVV